MPAPTQPCWRQCCCGDYWCIRHGEHVHDCACPPIEEWEISPYLEGEDPHHLELARQEAEIEAERAEMMHGQYYGGAHYGMTDDEIPGPGEDY